jgi:amidase
MAYRIEYDLLLFFSNYVSMCLNRKIEIMNFEEYRKYDALGLAALVKSKEVQASELLELAIQRTEAVNPKINAVVSKLYDLAKEQIKTIDANATFVGVPFLLKDLDAHLAGTRCTGGSGILKNYVSKETSETVHRAIKSGLIIFGKSNTPEFGVTPFTEGKLLGTAQNPWNLEHTTGGSSGGAGAAVAAGILPMAFASDGGGSIRIPASCNGLFGIKPSRGRISNGPMYGDPWNGAVTSGILSRSVRDAAAYIDVVQGPLAGDSFISQQPERPYLEEVKNNPGKLKIGYSVEHPIHGQQDAENIAAINNAVQLLRSMGHDVEEVKLPYTKQLLTEYFYTMVCSELSATVDFIGEERGSKPKRSELEPNTWLMYKLGKSFSANEYALAKMKWNTTNRAMGAFHQQYDLLLTPTLGMKPFKIGTLQNSTAEQIGLQVMNALGISSVVKYTGLIEKTAEKIFGWIPYAPLANMTGQPSMTVPLHWSQDNLPVGVMFTARMNDEAGLFRLAAQLEQAQPWFDRVPNL